MNELAIINKSRRIIKLKGGLGNQLFQYAFACLLKKETGEEVCIDMSSYHGLMYDSIRQPRILKFNISIPIAEKCEIKKACFFDHSGNMLTTKYRIGIALEAILNERYYFERDRRHRKISTIENHQYFDGYWQSYKYVDAVWNELRTELTPRVFIHPDTMEMINKVSKEQSVFIGVRKGDYQKNVAHFGTFSQDYYRKAMQYVLNQIDNPIFYVFTNDMEWVKENLNFDGYNVIYRDPKEVIDDFEDLLIMAACKHSIIINSTFHWWAARLNEYKGKLIIAPEHWFSDNKPIEIVPSRWIRI